VEEVVATLRSKFESTPRHAGGADVLTTQRYLLFAQTAQASGLQHAATVFRAVADGANGNHDDTRGALSASAMSVAGKLRVSRALPGR
jgi:rubrerythrin